MAITLFWFLCLFSIIYYFIELQTFYLLVKAFYVVSILYYICNKNLHVWTKHIVVVYSAYLPFIILIVIVLVSLLNYVHKMAMKFLLLEFSCCFLGNLICHHLKINVSIIWIHSVLPMDLIWYRWWRRKFQFVNDLRIIFLIRKLRLILHHQKKPTLKCYITYQLESNVNTTCHIYDIKENLQRKLVSILINTFKD